MHSAFHPPKTSLMSVTASHKIRTVKPCTETILQGSFEHLYAKILPPSCSVHAEIVGFLQSSWTSIQDHTAAFINYFMRTYFPTNNNYWGDKRLIRNVGCILLSVLMVELTLK